MPGGETIPSSERKALVEAGTNPRKKFAVRKGFSILDWGLLKSRTKDLAGRGGNPSRAITRNELKEHKSEHDCWMVHNGNVYNMTPFLHYHPGGVEILLQSTGHDCTALFNKYHAWVNATAMIGHLCIGWIVGGDDDGTGKEVIRQETKNEMSPPLPPNVK